MIEKEIKEYSQGNKTIQRINILKQDNIKGTVFILKPDEYNSLKAENKQLQEETLKQKELILELTSQMKKNDIFYEDITKKYEKHISDQWNKIEKLEKQQHETIKELDQQHSDQLKESYDKFNNDLQKYVAVNHLQNVALKQILELGFIDLVRNKHKKIAKKQIKKLNDKKVYELTPKTE